MKLTEKIVNAITGEETIVEREETAAETQARLDHAKLKQEAEATAKAKAQDKAALLQRLGISEDEAKLLLG
jgi:hypothetical protein